MEQIAIAQRRLFFSEKGTLDRKPLIIRVFAPRPVDPDSHLFRPDADTAICTVQFDGIPDAYGGETYGVDSIQALQLATDGPDTHFESTDGRAYKGDRLAHVSPIDLEVSTIDRTHRVLRK